MPDAFGEFAARLGEAFGVEEGAPGPPAGRSGERSPATGFGGPGGGRTITFEADDMPDLVPIARWALIGLAVIIALATAASASGQWETVQLWRNQVPFAPAGAPPVVDPIFGRDVSFYLFELPFLRAVQAMANGLLIAALVLSLGALPARRRRAAGSRSRPRCGSTWRSSAGSTSCRSRSATSSTSSSSCTAPRASATGVSFTDQNARFLAYDVLTAISAFAGAFLVIGAFTRAMWPLAAVVVVWLSASVVLGTVYPGARPALPGRARPAQPGDAVHRQQHQHDPARRST